MFYMTGPMNSFGLAVGAPLRDRGRGHTQAVSPVGALAPVAALEPLLLHSCSDRALHRDTRNAQEAFPQGKTLG